MAADEGKTEKPTPKKLRDARKEGNFPRTADAPTWLAVAGAAAMLPRTVAALTDHFRDLIARVPQVADDPTPARALAALAEVPMVVLLVAGPLALAAGAGAVLGAAAQGVHPSGKVMKPKFSRMSPKQGIKRMFGTKALWEAVKALMKVTVIALVVWSLARSLIPHLVGAGIMPLAVTVERTRSGMMTLLWATTVTGLILALFDYGYMRHTVMKQLRMSPHDIKQEMKQSEGDPMMKGAIRSRQLAMSRNRMLSAVADADVVLVNPTHFAVALSYQPHRGAPRVVARGAGALALKIRERAKEARVPVVEDKPLTRLLYRVCDLGDEIPAELYLAVAKILAFVMAAGRPGRTAGARRPLTTATLPELPAKSVMRSRRARQDRHARAGVA
ncbi:MAG: EscU/YscU/HrcU family type III secretion system export apparatus switch protein [Kineosporiaceae bacterium]